MDASERPEVALLSNGRYSVMLTDSGAGYSAWRDMDVTRWREDFTRDCWGQFIFVRDLGDGRTWSVSRQPTSKAADSYEFRSQPGRADIRRRDGDVETHLTVCVAPEVDAEIRVVTLTN